MIDPNQMYYNPGVCNPVQSDQDMHHQMMMEMHHTLMNINRMCMEMHHMMMQMHKMMTEMHHHHHHD
ncbi:MAG TPA: hypothetical protein VEC37_06775 [Bacillota bacterium]|nr:hypothetical protein [Bacillota bacterium]